MPVASFLLATLLLGQTPVKLAHTYVKDQKVSYEFSVTLSDQGSFKGTIEFKTLDEKGNHEINAPEIKASMGGNEETRELKIDKILLDPRGIAPTYQFNDQDIPFIVSTLCGYLPNKEVTKDTKFTIEEKLENYSIKGDGTMTGFEEKDSKKTATIQYVLHVAPSDNNEGILRIKSTFDASTGQLISSEGTVEIQGLESKVSIKRK